MTLVCSEASVLLIALPLAGGIVLLVGRQAHRQVGHLLGTRDGVAAFVSAW